MWAIGDVIGLNLDYAVNSGVDQCPEQLGPYWEWYSPSLGVFVEDPLAHVYCI